MKSLEPRMLDSCPVCHRHWAAIPTVSDAQVIHSQPFVKLVQALNELQQVLGPKSALGFKMLLELNPSMPLVSQK
jgi:hypothetical protein